MKTVFSVEESVALSIQRKQVAVEAAKDVITTLLETHSKSGNAGVVSSPVFAAYEERYNSKVAEFNEAKEAMLKDVVPEAMRKNMISWNLEYATCELTVELAANGVE